MLQYSVPAPAPAPLTSNHIHIHHDLQHQQLKLDSRPFSRTTSPQLAVSTNFTRLPSQSSPTSPRLPPYLASRRPADSSPAPSVLEGVLFPGDVVGQGLLLQGEPIRQVSIGLDSFEPPREFEVVRQLGTGSYAVVYLVREVLSRPPVSEDGHISVVGSLDFDGRPPPPQSIEYGTEYAIKCLSKVNLDEEALAAQLSEVRFIYYYCSSAFSLLIFYFLSQVTIHQSLPTHPNIVTLHRTFETTSYLLLLLEFVPGEDLFYFLEQSRDHCEANCPDSCLSSSRTPPTPSLLSTVHPEQLLSRTRLRLIASMFSQMCEAVAECHAHNVYHRDIKPENFIVTDGFSTTPDGHQERKVIVKLTDFGLSTREEESADMDCGSAPYMSYGAYALHID
jgi:serine/threonine protein kinase